MFVIDDKGHAVILKQALPFEERKVCAKVDLSFLGSSKINPKCLS